MIDLTLESRRRLLNTSLLGILVLSCGLFVTTLFLLETPYVGFNAFLTASLHVVYAIKSSATDRARACALPPGW
ncbi:hypothetical protein P43SY_007806 [Pythium insidiosum]|uniref:Uncharacterized protein n=1 Tax=Pythium insidiosum TaxID=114742 RepID=A0AAD5Q635_PYTIN|nr:hypothetical protein P43SY_007806 [Pythium insidiosum]